MVKESLYLFLNNILHCNVSTVDFIMQNNRQKRFVHDLCLRTWNFMGYLSFFFVTSHAANVSDKID